MGLGREGDFNNDGVVVAGSFGGVGEVGLDAGEALEEDVVEGSGLKLLGAAPGEALIAWGFVPGVLESGGGEDFDDTVAEFAVMVGVDVAAHDDAGDGAVAEEGAAHEIDMFQNEAGRFVAMAEIYLCLAVIAGAVAFEMNGIDQDEIAGARFFKGGEGEAARNSRNGRAEGFGPGGDAGELGGDGELLLPEFSGILGDIGGNDVELEARGFGDGGLHGLPALDFRGEENVGINFSDAFLNERDLFCGGLGRRIGGTPGEPFEIPGCDAEGGGRGGDGGGTPSQPEG